jgi:hypothetical protein
MARFVTGVIPETQKSAAPELPGAARDIRGLIDRDGQSYFDDFPAG